MGCWTTDLFCLEKHWGGGGELGVEHLLTLRTFLVSLTDHFLGPFFKMRSQYIQKCL